MGTVLGLLFIAAAAVTGIFVGTRPTVMDGRWIAAKLAEGGGGEGTIECDRAIRVGVSGAEFSCTHTHDGMHRQVWYRLTRDGSFEPLRSGPLLPGAPGAGAAGGGGGAGGDGDGGDGGGDGDGDGGGGGGDADGGEGDEAGAAGDPGAAGDERAAGVKGRREAGPRGSGGRRRAKASDE